MIYLTSFCIALQFATVLGSGHSSAPSCKEDEAACLQRFRSILTDPGNLWFGRCGTEQSYECQVNPSPNTTLLSRLLPTWSANDIQSVANSVNLVDVVYSGESYPHFSCGHQFPGTKGSSSGLRVEPLQTTKWDLAKVQTTPSVSWPSVSNGMKYTVIVIDMGFFYLHGFYINCQNSMTDGQQIYRYSGPKNPRPEANAFLWVVLPQLQGDLDIAAVSGVVFGQLAANEQQFNFAQFAQSFGFGLNALQQSAMTLLNIEGDAYGAEFIKGFGFGNQCPLIASRNKYLHSATQWAQIPAAWSHDVTATMTSRDPHDLPYLTSLDMVMDVTYNSEDIEFESCCSQTAHIRAQLTPDPFKAPTEYPERPVQVRNAPRVRLSTVFSNAFNPQLNARQYTLMLVDFGSDFRVPSSPAPSDPAFIVHWLVANISRSDVTTGVPLIPYFGSNPFSRDSSRMYTFLLLEQSKPLNPANLRKYVKGNCGSFPQRCAYRVNQLLADWGLNDIRGVNWFFAEQDAFARQRIYRTWSARDKSSVCSGIPGFNYVCCWKSWWINNMD